MSLNLDYYDYNTFYPVFRGDLLLSLLVWEYLYWHNNMSIGIYLCSNHHNFKIIRYSEDNCILNTGIRQILLIKAYLRVGFDPAIHFSPHWRFNKLFLCILTPSQQNENLVSKVLHKKIAILNMSI